MYTQAKGWGRGGGEPTLHTQTGTGGTNTTYTDWDRGGVVPMLYTQIGAGGYQHYMCRLRLTQGGYQHYIYRLGLRGVPTLHTQAVAGEGVPTLHTQTGSWRGTNTTYIDWGWGRGYPHYIYRLGLWGNNTTYTGRGCGVYQYYKHGVGEVIPTLHTPAGAGGGGTNTTYTG